MNMIPHRTFVFDRDYHVVMLSKTPTNPLFNQLKTMADMEAIPADKRLEMSKAAHIGRWYDDNYQPYCVHYLCKCTSPRMRRTSYGFQCPDCGDIIGWDFKRLQESPLNFIPLESIPKQFEENAKWFEPAA